MLYTMKLSYTVIPMLQALIPMFIPIFSIKKA